MANSTNFRVRAERIAYFEANGWRAYYDRRWLHLLRLIVSLCQEQFGIPFPASLFAAYDIVRASIAWVPLDHDEQVVQRYYTRFYERAQHYSGLNFDPVRAGALEMKYNDVHRKLSGLPDKTELTESLIELHCTLFGLTPDEARESAELRTQAATTVDLITSHTSADPEADWIKLEGYLRQCYESIGRIVQARFQLDPSVTT